MSRRDATTKTIATIGSVVVALPIVAPLVLGLRFAGGPVGYRVDYLMPFEVYPVTVVGMILVVWAAMRAHAHRRGVWLSIAGMIGGILLAGISAQVTGIANSVETLARWKYVLTAALGAGSLVAQVALIVMGFLIVRDAGSAQPDATPPATQAPTA
jgi:hypothetical protein